MRKILEGKQIMMAEKMWQKSHCDSGGYTPDIINQLAAQTAENTIFEHNNCLFVAFVSQWRVRKPPTGTENVEGLFQ